MSMIKLVSINVGLPREVVWEGKTVLTGIFKEPVGGIVNLRTLNLDGDGQADLSVHGGRDKAVYAYPAEHYDYWRGELSDLELPWGMFGENFTTVGLSEDQVNIGDRFRIGSSVVMVTQPRMPCYKLGIKFGRESIIKLFLASGRSGIYFKVLEEGEVMAGNTIELIDRDKNNVTVADIVRLYAHEKTDPVMLRRAIEVEALPESWRDYFQTRLEKLTR